MGLFDNVNAIVEAENQQRIKEFGGGVGGRFSNIGFQIGQALRRGISDEDTRSPQVRRGQSISETVAGIDFNTLDPKQIRATAEQLNTQGFNQEAVELLKLIPTAKKTAVGEPFLQSIVDPTNPGNFVLQRFQNFSDGSQSPVGSALKSDQVDQTTIGNLPAQVFGDVGVREEDAVNILARFAQRDEFQSLFPSGSTAAEELAPFVGEIKSVANQIKREEVNALLPLLEQGQITQNQFQAALDSEVGYLRKGFSRFVEGGGLEASIDRDFIGGADVEVRGDIDATNIDALNQEIIRGNKKADAVAEVAGRTDRLVVADPRGKGFRLSKMDPENMQAIFSRMDQKSNDDIRKALEDLGFQFDGRLFDTHAQRWELLRENPVTTQQYLTNRSDSRVLESHKARTLESFLENEDFQGWATTREIFRYLDRLGDVKGKRKTGQSSRLPGKPPRRGN